MKPKTRKAMKPVMAWAGIVNGTVHWWNGVPMIFQTRQEARNQYERVLRVRISEVK